MKKTLFFAGIATLLAFKPANQSQLESKILKIKSNGTLEYIADKNGNIIPDFSRVGYHQGDKPLPNIPVVKTLSPKGEDDRKAIQEAIDEVSAMPVKKNGFRGTILLKKGTYKVHGSLEIKKGGIVLRGEGDHENGTKIIAAGKGQRSLIKINGEGSLKEIEDSRVKIKTPYVPVGSFTFEVETAANFKPGDKIVLHRPGTDNWISDIQMDRIIEREGTRQWKASEYHLNFERKIIKIDGNTITMDNPVVMQMENKYGGGYIFKYDFKGRISEVGVENILFESEYENDKDEDHGWVAVNYSKAENCWVRNVTSKYFGNSCVSLSNTAKQITVIDSKCLDAKSIITGARRYSFNNDGQLNLFMNLETTEGRHDYVTGAKTLGPNVFYNCKSTGTHADIGPHHRWAVGTLYDNIITDGEINVQDRGNWGSGHGWAGITQVLWNCKVKRAAIQSPWVSGDNYSIGTKGEKFTGRLAGKPDGIWVDQNKDVKPQSLYISQLNARKKK